VREGNSTDNFSNRVLLRYKLKGKTFEVCPRKRSRKRKVKMGRERCKFSL